MCQTGLLLISEALFSFVYADNRAYANKESGKGSIRVNDFYPALYGELFAHNGDDKLRCLWYIY
jgi:hypothetical protein